MSGRERKYCLCGNKLLNNLWNSLETPSAPQSVGLPQHVLIWLKCDETGCVVFLITWQEAWATLCSAETPSYTQSSGFVARTLSCVAIYVWGQSPLLVNSQTGVVSCRKITWQKVILVRGRIWGTLLINFSIADKSLCTSKCFILHTVQFPPEA